MSKNTSEHNYERQIRNLNALLEVSKVLASERTLDKLLQIIVEKTTEVMDADRSSLFIYDEETNELWSKIAQGLELKEIRFPVGVGIAGEVAKTREGTNILDAYNDSRFNKEFDQKTGYRTQSVLCLPMLNNEDELVGVIQVLNKKDGSSFDNQDEKLLAALGAHAAVALEQARLIEDHIEKERMQKALELAHSIQVGLMPQSAPKIKNFDIAGFSIACDETGGDYYDFVELPDGRLVFIVGDVAGHGLGAAIFMATARASLRTVLMSIHEPDKILYQVNNRLTLDMADEAFMTLFLGILDPVDKTLRYTSAGHEDPLLYRAADGAFDHLSSTGLPLGMIEEAQFPEGQMSLFNEGDILLLTTDGIFEAMNEKEEQMGHDRMKEVLKTSSERSAEEITQELRKQTFDFMGNARPRDDITVVTIKAICKEPIVSNQTSIIEELELEEEII